MNWEEVGPLAGTPISSGEIVSHFLYRKEFPNMKVKGTALLPDPWDNLSVTRRNGLADEEIWECGKMIAASANPPRTLKARADLVCTEAVWKDSGLSAASDEPPRNHAIIVGWAAQLEDRLIQSEILADSCVCVLCPA